MGRKDFFQFKNFSIHQGHAAMKLGTDSDLLGTLSDGGNKILDIGTGTGVLSLMLAQRYPDAHITAVEIDDNAIIDAEQNFNESPYSDRISLIHTAFQDYAENSQKEIFDSVVCNPPYFDQSLECGDNVGRTRARHSSSLPFSDLIGGAYALLKQEGVFSVCIPPEVLSKFSAECLLTGFCLKASYMIKSVPDKGPKRYVLIYKKGTYEQCKEYTYCMRNDDRTVSDWYKELMKDFHLHPNKKN